MDKFAAMRVFVKIADAANLSATGRQLGLSLTSVSRQLMALEEVLGTTLVQRTTRHLSLTECQSARKRDPLSACKRDPFRCVLDEANDVSLFG
jgi:hypothetical protein